MRRPQPGLPLGRNRIPSGRVVVAVAWLAAVSALALPAPLAAQTADDGWLVPPISRGPGDAGSRVLWPPWHSARLSEAPAGWPEVRLDEAAGAFEPLVRGGSDPLDVLHFPVLTDAAELNLASFPLLGGLGVPRFFGRIRGEYADDFDNQTRIGGSAHLRATPVYGFDIEWHYRRRHRPHRRDESLWTGDANFVYQLINVKMISMRAGGGVAWLADDDRGRAGYNFTYGADFFLRRPWLMTLEFDTGRISGESLHHARGTIGYVVGQWELYTGWDWYKVGDRAFDGLIGGVTLWF